MVNCNEEKTAGDNRAFGNAPGRFLHTWRGLLDVLYPRLYVILAAYKGGYSRPIIPEAVERLFMLFWPGIDSVFGKALE